MIRLKRNMRMKSRGEFSRVRREGKSFIGRYLVLGCLPDSGIVPRLKFGIILTRKVGNAVIRNRVRRRLRGILSELGEALAFSGYLVMIPRRRAPSATFDELRNDWKKLVAKAGIVSDSRLK